MRSLRPSAPRSGEQASTSLAVTSPETMLSATTTRMIPSELAVLLELANLGNGIVGIDGKHRVQIENACHVLLKIHETFVRTGRRSTGILSPESIPTLWQSLATLMAARQKRKVKRSRKLTTPKTTGTATETTAATPIAAPPSSISERLKDLSHLLEEHTLRVIELLPPADFPAMIAAMRQCRCLGDRTIGVLAKFMITERSVQVLGGQRQRHAALAATFGAVLPAKSAFDTLPFSASRDLLAELGNLTIEDHFPVHKAAHVLVRSLVRAAPAAPSATSSIGEGDCPDAAATVHRLLRESTRACGLVRSVCRYSITDDRLISIVEGEFEQALPKLFLPQIISMLSAFAQGPVSGSSITDPARIGRKRKKAGKGRRRHLSNQFAAAEYELPVQFILPLVGRAVQIIQRRMLSVTDDVIFAQIEQKRTGLDERNCETVVLAGQAPKIEANALLSSGNEVQVDVKQKPTQPTRRQRTLSRRQIRAVLWEPLLTLFSIHCQLHYPEWLRGHELIVDQIGNISQFFMQPNECRERFGLTSAGIQKLSSLCSLEPADVVMRILKPALRRRTMMPPSRLLDSLRRLAMASIEQTIRQQEQRDAASGRSNRPPSSVLNVVPVAALSWIYISAAAFSSQPSIDCVQRELQNDARAQAKPTRRSSEVPQQQGPPSSALDVVFPKFYTQLSPTGCAAALTVCSLSSMSLTAQVELVNYVTASVAPAIHPKWYAQAFHAICMKVPDALDSIALHKWSSRFAASHKFVCKLRATDIALVLDGLANLYRLHSGQVRAADPHWREVALGKKALVHRVLVLSLALENADEVVLLATALGHAHVFYAPIFSRFCRRVWSMVSAIDWAASSASDVLQALSAFQALAVEYVSYNHQGSAFDDLWGFVRHSVIENAHHYSSPDLIARSLNAFAVLDVLDNAVFSTLLLQLRRLLPSEESSGSSPTSPVRLGENHDGHDDLFKRAITELNPSALSIILRILLSDFIEAHNQDGRRPTTSLKDDIWFINRVSFAIRTEVKALYPTELVTLMGPLLRMLSLSSSVQQRHDQATSTAVVPPESAVTTVVELLPDLGLIHAVYDTARELVISTYGSYRDSVRRSRRVNTDKAGNGAGADNGEVENAVDVVASVDQAIAVEEKETQSNGVEKAALDRHTRRCMHIDSTHFITLAIALSDSGILDRELARVCADQITARALMDCLPQTLVHLFIGQCVQFSDAPERDDSVNPSEVNLVALEDMKTLRKEVLRPCLDAMWKRTEQLDEASLLALERAVLHFFGAKADKDFLLRISRHRELHNQAKVKSQQQQQQSEPTSPASAFAQETRAASRDAINQLFDEMSS